MGLDAARPSSTNYGLWHWSLGLRLHNLTYSSINSDQLFLGLLLLTSPATLRHVMQLIPLWLFVTWPFHLRHFHLIARDNLMKPYSIESVLRLQLSSGLIWHIHRNMDLSFLCSRDIFPLQRPAFTSIQHCTPDICIIDSSQSGRGQGLVHIRIGRIFLNLPHIVLTLVIVAVSQPPPEEIVSPW